MRPIVLRSSVPLTGHTERVSVLAVAADGSWLASAAGDSVRLWAPEGRRLGAVRLAAPITAVITETSRQQLTAGGLGGVYHLALVR